MSRKLPDHIDGLIQYLSSPEEKANEDLIIKYFRRVFGDKFTRQKEASSSDGYMPGHFVVELKGKTSDWLAGFFQGIAYGKTLDFSIVVVAAKGFLSLWSIDDIDEEIVAETLKAKGAPNAIGKRLAKKYKSKSATFLKRSAYQFPPEYLSGLFQGGPLVIKKEVDSFEKTLKQKKRVRHKITTKNFPTALKQMVDYFESDKPIKVVRAFYSMIFGWDHTSMLDISARRPSQAALGGEVIEFLKPGKREQFKKFVESHYIHLEENENIDDFFAKYDQALDAVDPKFRVKHGIFFTDLDLSKFVMWYVRKNLGDIGKNYLVIDPACGSGNLVTNWRSPLELRHKVVSEIEPELLYTVEQRMKGDKWHNGKFTVVPKVSENKGLNFLDKSAEEYIETIKDYLVEKGHKPNKPIAFLCNPPYRSDDDQAADSVKYRVHPSILELTGTDGSAERYCCFLSQMKLICEKAEESGLPDESLLLLFTKAAWLTKRPVFEAIRRNICSTFEDVGGMIVNSKEFFDVKGKFPIAFTMWKYKGEHANLDENRPIELLDLTWMKKTQLSGIDWLNDEVVSEECSKIVDSDETKKVNFGAEIPSIKTWSGLKRFDFQREKRKAEKSDPRFQCGLPKNDPRHSRKKTLGECDGEYIGFLDDLTPCRIKNPNAGGVWFYLDNRFMRVRTNRCFSGPPDNRGHYAFNLEEARAAFMWFALGKVFASHGYPMWVDADEMWALVPPDSLHKKLTKLSFAIGFAENECVESVFPAGNPVKQAKEISVGNPMTPLDPKSFWNTTMASFFGQGSDPEDRLVASVNEIFSIWKKKIKKSSEIYVSYEKSYFVGEGVLRLGAGLIQIKDYARETNETELLKAVESYSSALKDTKEEFNRLLHAKSGFNYFEVDEKRFARIVKEEKIVEPINVVAKSGFAHTVDMRLALASKIVDEMVGSKEFSRVKFAKVFYLADCLSGKNLKTEYTREAAGPLDQRTLYNEKYGIEPNAAARKLFETEKRKGKEFDFVKYKVGSQIQDGLNLFDEYWSESTKQIERIIELTKPMTRDQVEIISTLYACWNDLLISKKNVTNESLVKEFKDRWHPEKSKKFKATKNKKPRFTEEKLVKAIAWMKEKGLVPKGSGKKTKIKPSKDDIIPF